MINKMKEIINVAAYEIAEKKYEENIDNYKFEYDNALRDYKSKFSDAEKRARKYCIGRICNDTRRNLMYYAKHNFGLAERDFNISRYSKEEAKDFLVFYCGIMEQKESVFKRELGNKRNKKYVYKLHNRKLLDNLKNMDIKNDYYKLAKTFERKKEGEVLDEVVADIKVLNDSVYDYIFRGTEQLPSYIRGRYVFSGIYQHMDLVYKDYKKSGVYTKFFLNVVNFFFFHWIRKGLVYLITLERTSHFIKRVHTLLDGVDEWLLGEKTYKIIKERFRKKYSIFNRYALCTFATGTLKEDICILGILDQVFAYKNMKDESVIVDNAVMMNHKYQIEKLVMWLQENNYTPFDLTQTSAWRGIYKTIWIDRFFCYDGKKIDLKKILKRINAGYYDKADGLAEEVFLLDELLKRNVYKENGDASLYYERNKIEQRMYAIKIRVYDLSLETEDFVFAQMCLYRKMAKRMFDFFQFQ